MNKLQTLHLEAIDNTIYTYHNDTLLGKNQACEKSAQITENITIELLEWLSSEKSKYGILYGEQTERFCCNDRDYTSKEIFDLFVKTKM
jgi:hypothetical protein